MTGLELLKSRRSVRKYTEEKVSRDTINEIVDIARFAPSWANTQVVRYNIVDNEQKLESIAETAVKGFVYNTATLKKVKGVVVLSYVNGESGSLEDKKGVDTTKEKSTEWGTFDAGLACQTFCLAAYAKGVGTCIFGIIDQEAIAEIIDLPSNETIAALIVYGYPEGETKTPPRKELTELVRFVE